MNAMYIRSVIDYSSTIVQKEALIAFATQKGMVIEKEYIEHASNAKRLSDRKESISYFQSLKNEILIIYDIWVLSSFAEDLVRLFSCLLKNNVTIKIAKSHTKIDRETSSMILLGLIDSMRQEETSTKNGELGRPKGSQSRSKFDILGEQIIAMLRQKMSVSTIAKSLKISRSSLKDYIESRRLKELAFGSEFLEIREIKQIEEKELIEKIECPEGT